MVNGWLNCNFHLNSYLIYLSICSYAPWCPACKQFKPVWDEFSKAMLSKNIKVAAIDVDQHPSLSGRFGISALPTVYQ